MISVSALIPESIHVCSQVTNNIPSLYDIAYQMGSSVL
jgi:hypothetical protein